MLVDFWTYTCINCIRTLPYLRAWDAAYRARGLTIVGVHTPEFSFERDAGNVEDAIAQNRLRYPVAQDNEYATWNAWGNQYWPAKYLIDAKGRVRYVHFGEGDDDKTEAAIRSLLAEAGAERLGGDAKVGATETRRQRGDAGDLPRLGARRAAGCPASRRDGTRTYAAAARRLPESRFALGGPLARRRRVRRGGARRDARRQRRRQGRLPRAQLTRRQAARQLGSSSTAARSARPTPGADVHGGRVTVRRQRLYRLVSLAEDRAPPADAALRARASRATRSRSASCARPSPSGRWW